MTWRIEKALPLDLTTYALALSRDFAGEPVDVVAVVGVLTVSRLYVERLYVDRVDGSTPHQRASAEAWLLGDGNLEALLACSVAAGRAA